MVFVGLISYPLYLWHWPLLSFAHIVGLGIVSTPLTVGLLVASVVLAIGTYLFLEQPLHRKLLSWRLGGSMVAIMACFGIGGGAVYTSGGMTWSGTSAASRLILYRKRVSEAMRARPGNTDAYLTEMGLSRLKAVRSGICESAGSPDTVKDEPICGKPVDGAKNIIVMGDSIASDTYAWLHTAYPEYNVIQRTGPGCNLLRDVKDNPKPCAAMMQSALEIALSSTDRIDAVVLVSLWDSHILSPNQFAHTRTEPLIDKLLARGRKVVLVGPPVGFTVSPRDLIDKCPSSSKDGLTPEELEQCAKAHSNVYRECNTALKQYAQQKGKGLSYVDLHELTCNDSECRILDDEGQLMFTDTWHRSFPGDAFVARRVRQNHVFERILDAQ